MFGRKQPTIARVIAETIMNPLKATSILFATLIWVSPASATQKFYRWVDQDGTVHYTTQKPPESNAETIEVDAKAPPNNAAIRQSTQDDASGEQPVVDPERELQVMRECEKARQGLELIDSRIRLYADDGSGGRKYLTAEEKAAQARDFKQFIRKNCS